MLEYGIDNYNEACRGIVMRYSSDWRSIITRLGRWIDFDNDYKTMDPSFMESVWWVFSEMNRKGLVYRGFKVVLHEFIYSIRAYKSGHAVFHRLHYPSLQL